MGAPRRMGFRRMRARYVGCVGQRVRAWLWVVGVVGVLGVVPVVLDRDSYPVSTYPMFSYRRTTTETVDTAILVVDGDVRRLSPTTIADTDEVILAAATVSNAIASGTAAVLCAEIAGRVGTVENAAGGSGGASAAEIRVVTERFDSVRWYEGDKEPLERVVHATCPAGAGS